MSKNKIGEDSPIPKFVYLKIQRRDGVEIFDDPWGGWVQGAHWWLHKGALDNILNFFHFWLNWFTNSKKNWKKISSESEEIIRFIVMHA